MQATQARGQDRKKIVGGRPAQARGSRAPRERGAERRRQGGRAAAGGGEARSRGEESAQGSVACPRLPRRRGAATTTARRPPPAAPAAATRGGGGAAAPAGGPSRGCMASHYFHGAVRAGGGEGGGARKLPGARPCAKRRRGEGRPGKEARKRSSAGRPEPSPGVAGPKQRLASCRGGQPPARDRVLGGLPTPCSRRGRMASLAEVVWVVDPPCSAPPNSMTSQAVSVSRSVTHKSWKNTSLTVKNSSGFSDGTCR